MTIAYQNTWNLVTNIGKTAVFLQSVDSPNKMYSFSSTLEKVGVEWDCSLQNNTAVLILSDPVEVHREKYGAISLTKIRANVATDFHTIMQEMWVRTDCLVDIR